MEDLSMADEEDYTTQAIHKRSLMMLFEGRLELFFMA